MVLEIGVDWRPAHSLLVCSITRKGKKVKQKPLLSPDFLTFTLLGIGHKILCLGFLTQLNTTKPLRSSFLSGTKFFFLAVQSNSRVLCPFEKMF